VSDITPVVTVIMPMKNAENFVYDAISSVLNQSFKFFELIVVDDGSTDSSRKIVELFDDDRASVIAGPQTGVSDAFNLALSLAKGKYVCNCDSDDLYPENRLDWQVKWMEDHPGFDAVCGTYSTMDPRGNILSEFDCGQVGANIGNELLLGKTRTSFCTFLTKIGAVVELDGCRSYFTTSQDIDLQLRMAGKYNIWYEPRNTYYYRLHDSSITHSQASNKRVFFEDTARKFLKQRVDQGQDDIDRGMPPAIPDFDLQASSSKHQISGILTSEAWRLHRKGHRVKAVKKGFIACMNEPASFVRWRNLLALIIK